MSPGATYNTESYGAAAITKDGTVYRWGNNSAKGQIGNGSVAAINAPTKIYGLDGQVKQVFGSRNAYFALTKD
jgi:alpha-tubulin suppressor-like RCC1 family protein